MKTLIGITILAAAAAILPMQAPPNAEVPHYQLPDPVTDADFYDNGAPAKEKMELGRVLFFDKILSGNKNISCATCHHPKLGTSDGLALGFGEGADGLGRDRKPGKGFENGVHERVPRNSPALFNLGAREFTVMFHDGRVEVDSNGYYVSGFITPAKWKMPEGLDNVLAAQAMFPVTSPTEMAGQKGENEIANQRSLNNVAGPDGVWEILAKRLQAIPEYVDRFKAAYPDQVKEADDITMVLAANAIAAFEAECFRADNSEFDRYLRGQARMSKKAKRGMDLFYGKADCGSCHSGVFQTDHDFHGIAMVQVGPGKNDGADGSYWRETGQRAFLEDFGRGRVTVREKDKFKFRTPSLRNEALTGPWGHAGAYDSLEEVVRHHLDPEKCLGEFECDDDMLFPLDRVLELSARGSQLKHQWMSERRARGFNQRDTWVQENPEMRARIAEANELDPVELSDDEVEAVIAFLEALTDPTSEDLTREIPDEVPSGLPVDR